MTTVWDFILRLFTQKIAAVAATAFLLALAMACVVVLLLARHINYSPTDFVIDMDGKIFVAIVFILLFFVFWFILYIQTERNLVDVFSETREKLYGNWTVTYSSIKALDGRVIFPERTAVCSVRENLIKKLEFSFSILGNNPIFDAQTGQVVRDIALRANEQNGYTLFYFYESKRILSQNLKDLLPPDDPHRENISIEVFASLTFENPGKTGHVQKMSGKWYDLNGNMMRIFKLIDMHELSIANKQSFNRTMLLSVPIEQKNFDADMGSIEFVYVGQNKADDPGI